MILVSLPELAESSVSSQISRYSFATPLINDFEHETVDSNVVTFSGPSESSRAEYNFMVVPIDSSSSESPKFHAMIQQMISNASSFSTCLEFMSESNLPPSAGLDVCPSRYFRYIIFSSLGIMPRVPTVLHLPVAHIGDIIRPIAIRNDTYKFVAYPYSIWQEFAVDNKVMITSHLESVRKLHVWRTDLI